MLESIKSDFVKVEFMSKQKRLVLILIMPLMVVIWTIGWGLYCTGFKRFLENRIKSPIRNV